MFDLFRGPNTAKRRSLLPFVIISVIIASPITGCKSGGDSDSSDSGVIVFNANFTASPLTGQAPLQVQFSDISTGDIDTWAWDFENDGNVDSTVQNPTHIYSDAGQYTVTLVITGPEGTDTATRLDYIKASDTPPAGDPSAYFPPWHDIAPDEIIEQNHDGGLTNVQNGATLKDAILALTPGQMLSVGTGTYSIDSLFNLNVNGTASKPIWIVAANGATPVITRPNASQNTVNINSTYLCLRGLEITGGSIIMRLYGCSNLWIDQCHLHHGDVNGLTANSGATHHLYITRNLIENTPRSGIYCGTHDGSYGMTDSIIALNHIHHCGLADNMGYGIQIKQNSYDNLVAENHVHDTHWPCVIIYGTSNMGINTIERNVIYNSNDTVLQVQGEAVVRNNLVMGDTVGFTSRYHTDDPCNLTVVHNTIITTANATSLADWNGASGMIFANNAVYSRDGGSIRFPDGSSGVTVTGNVVLGSVSNVSGGYVTGTGLSDFVNVTWDTTNRDGAPSAGSPLIGAADAAYGISRDITGETRSGALDTGAYDYK